VDVVADGEAERGAAVRGDDGARGVGSIRLTSRTASTTLAAATSVARTRTRGFTGRCYPAAPRRRTRLNSFEIDRLRPEREATGRAYLEFLREAATRENATR